jgi:hypothetical protein
MFASLDSMVMTDQVIQDHYFSPLAATLAAAGRAVVEFGAKMDLVISAFEALNSVESSGSY